MGKSSIARVYEDWNHLDHQPFRVLGRLALSSIDIETPPIYYAGWEALAAAARIPWDPEEPDLAGMDAETRQATIKARASARRNSKARVNKILRALEDAGAIVRSGGAQAGQRQVIGLTLDPRLTYAAEGWTRRQRTRRGADGDAVAYSVPVPDWQPVDREDPRPDSPPVVAQTPPPGGASDTTGGESQTPPEVVPDALEWSSLRHHPRSSEDPVEEAGEETAPGRIPIPSQRKPSTRVDASRRDDDEGSISQDQRANDQGRRLREMFGDLDAWTPDAEEATA
ncbi:hypothetical protein [Micrococcus luteus]|uniref:hypothetical protein n=1 Tax=Micrococcus luteus TaxID=1270 RepID=UPI0038264FC3